jgi:hypothetical protein
MVRDPQAFGLIAMHRLLVISVLFVLAGAAGADSDVVLETAKSSTVVDPSPPPASKAEYVSTDVSAMLSSAEIRKTSERDFKQCLEDWDAATHMTKKEWERTCRRVVDGRVKFMAQQRWK